VVISIAIIAMDLDNVKVVMRHMQLLLLAPLKFYARHAKRQIHHAYILFKEVQDKCKKPI